MKTVLVTGSSGFLGQHLCQLLAANFRVVATYRSNSQPPLGVKGLLVDGGLAQAVNKIKPDIVIHAAFINRKPPTMTEREYINNVLSENLSLYEQVIKYKAKLLVISSSSVYGNGDGRILIDESCPIAPKSLYGFAKTVQEMTTQYNSALGLYFCIVRLFNLCGPGQKPGMLLPDWVQQARAVAAGKIDVVKVRHRKTTRDFVDVRDAARAISLIAQNFPSSGEIFNVASGKAISLMEISQELEQICPVTLKIVETEANVTTTDVKIQCGSYHKIHTRYGWSPEINWRKSLRDLWDSY